MYTFQHPAVIFSRVALSVHETSDIVTMFYKISFSIKTEMEAVHTHILFALQTEQVPLLRLWRTKLMDQIIIDLGNNWA
jgi:hypothetical protein